MTIQRKITRHTINKRVVEFRTLRADTRDELNEAIEDHKRRNWREKSVSSERDGTFKARMERFV